MVLNSFEQQRFGTAGVEGVKLRAEVIYTDFLTTL